MAKVTPASGLTIRANKILNDARDFACSHDRAGDSCQVPIILAAIAIEAFFNELEELSSYGPSPLTALHTILAELENSHASTRSKFQIAHFTLTGEVLDRGVQPWQDLQLLLQLRDALVHSKAATFNMGTPERGANFKIVRALSSRGLIPTNSERTPRAWSELALTSEVARWARDVALRVINLLVSQLPNGLTREAFETLFDLPAIHNDSPAA